MNIDAVKHYINYRLGNENFAIPVEMVLEIIQHRTLTSVPNSSKFILGVINFRGEIIPVINMHRRFNIIKPENDQGMIVVINSSGKTGTNLMGLMVDCVEDVTDFKFNDIRKPNDIGINYDLGFIEGIVDIKQRFVIVLNIENVLKKTELAEAI